MNIYTKTCKYCNKEITGRPNKLFCDRNCKTYHRRRPYRVHKKDICEKCNFIPEYSCQLDVDHIDGNHKNNNPENLQTLCANCHRLKTFFQRTNTKNKKRKKEESFFCSPL